MKTQYLALAYVLITAPVAGYVSYECAVECMAGKFEWGMVAAVSSVWFAVFCLPFAMLRWGVNHGA